MIAYNVNLCSAIWFSYCLQIIFELIELIDKHDCHEPYLYNKIWKSNSKKPPICIVRRAHSETSCGEIGLTHTSKTSEIKYLRKKRGIGSILKKWRTPSMSCSINCLPASLNFTKCSPPTQLNSIAIYCIGCQRYRIKWMSFLCQNGCISLILSVICWSLKMPNNNLSQNW